MKQNENKITIVDVLWAALEANHELELFDKATKRTGFSKKALRLMNYKNAMFNRFEEALSSIIMQHVQHALEKNKVVIINDQINQITAVES